MLWRAFPRAGSHSLTFLRSRSIYCGRHADGRLSWIIDGCLLHPRAISYSAPSTLAGSDSVNYIPHRLVVKAVVDEHTTALCIFYVFDNQDPIPGRMARHFFRGLLQRSIRHACVVGRAHVRYPETLLRHAGRSIRRSYHMTDPEVFYNREDQCGAWLLKPDRIKETNRRRRWSRTLC